MPPFLVVLYTTLSPKSTLSITLCYNPCEVVCVKVLKEKISITIDGDIIESIKKLADNDERSMSQYINLVLRKHIEEKKEEKE